MREYIILNGDTFESIAKKIYGTGDKQGDILGSNPGILEPLTPGLSLNIPDDVDQPPVTSRFNSSGRENEVSVNIDGSRFRFWTEISIERAIDSFDVITFNSPLSINNVDFIELFKPFTYKGIEVTIGQDVIFRGVMLSPLPELKPNIKTVSIIAYALPSVLEDCNAPVSAFPLEFDNLNIVDIAKKLCRLFGVRVQATENVGAVFTRVALGVTKTIHKFLIGLAKQRNLIISNTPDGALLIQRSITTGQPVAKLREGLAPLVSVLPNFNPRKYYSHITGFEPTVAGLKGSQYTVRNSRLKGAIRPFNFSVSDTLNSDVQAAVLSKTGRMFANAVSYNVSMSTWRDTENRLWSPNTFINVFAPGAMIKQEYKFLIRRVSLIQQSRKETASLNLVLPGVFGGQMPEVLPWD